MNKSTIYLAVFSSLFSLAYLIKGVLIIKANRQLTESRPLLFTQYADHNYYTAFLLAMAATLGANYLKIVAVAIFFIIAKYTNAFGLHNLKRNFSPMLSNLGTVISLLPMTLLSFYNLSIALKWLVKT